MEQDNFEPNWQAQSLRHKRVFLKSLFFSRRLFRFILDLKSFFLRPYRRIRMDAPVTVRDPFKKLLRQTIAISVALLVVTSIAPHSILETGFTAEYFGDDSDFIQEEDELALPPFLMNEEGFVLKTSPASEEPSRTGFTDSVQHTIQGGDTLSSIASLYRISVKTLVWENNIHENSPLRIGQTLVIPPLDGVTHSVTGKNETLSSIAKQYAVDAKLISEHNSLEGDVIQKGQKIFVPGGKKKENPIVFRAGSRSSGRSSINTFDNKLVMSSSATPDAGKELIFPTSGKLTQGFRAGHYALDVGNAAKPDIWAASPGTVVSAKGGCQPREVKINRSCNGGFGNVVIVDHGGGLQTLYAHLETVYVSEGQRVERGQSLGKMGSSGRTYGKTGIHLHFEVYDNGVKKNPANYF